MIRFNQLARVGALTACVALGSAAFTPVAAVADNMTNLVVAGAVGAIVGSLIFDSSRNQYYYNNGGRHVYVSNGTAGQWYQRQDPTFYRAHQSDFQHNPARFNQAWHGAHHGHSHG